MRWLRELTNLKAIFCHLIDPVWGIESPGEGGKKEDPKQHHWSIRIYQSIHICIIKKVIVY